jgi:hypothetical protein
MNTLFEQLKVEGLERRGIFRLQRHPTSTGPLTPPLLRRRLCHPSLHVIHQSHGWTSIWSQRHQGHPMNVAAFTAAAAEQRRTSTALGSIGISGTRGDGSRLAAQESRSQC